MFMLAAILFLSALLMFFFAGLVLAIKLGVACIVAYGIYKLFQWLFD